MRAKMGRRRRRHALLTLAFCHVIRARGAPGSQPARALCHSADSGKAVGNLRSILAVCILLGSAAPILAQTKPKPPAAPAPATAATPSPQALGTFDRWIAAFVGEGANKVCYMRTKPSSSESRPARLRRGDVAVAVTHRPGAKQRDEVSFDAGYAIKDGAIVAVEIGQKRFQMFNRPSVDPETAWSADTATDKAMVEAMRAGQAMIVRAVSARGSETVDTVPLAGFAKAYAEIGKACGIK